MKAKDFLKRYLWAKREMQSIEMELDDYRYSKMHPYMVYDDMPHGTDQKDLSDYAVKYDELITKFITWKKKCESILTEIQTVLDKIGKLKNGEILRTVLVMKYINGESWGDIADELHYSERWVIGMHGKALKEVEEIINDGSRRNVRNGRVSDHHGTRNKQSK